MQTASLQNGFLQPRADTHSSGGNAAGAGSFKSTFESLVNDRHQQRDSDAILPQDERTIHRTREREAEKISEAEGISESDANQPASRGQRADADTQEEQSEAPSAKTREKEPVEEKPKTSDDKNEGQADAAAIAAAAANAPVTNEDPEQVVEPQAVAIEGVDTSAAIIDPLQPALKGNGAAGEVAEEVVGQAVPATHSTTDKPGEKSKLDKLTSQMDAVPESADSLEKTVEATSSTDGEEQSDDLLNQAAVKLPGDEKSTEAKAAPSTFDRDLTALQNNTQPAAKADTTQAVKMQPLPTLTPEQQFVQDNVDQVVTSVRTQAIAGGGSMHVRLDPPELGALEVAVKMVEGRLTASFTTSNEQATQLLSHSLQHLKSSLEASGVTVDRIEVRQAPQSESSNSKSNSDSQQQQQRGFDSQSQQSEQNRKEMVRKMWRKLAFGTDDLDLVA